MKLTFSNRRKTIDRIAYLVSVMFLLLCAMMVFYIIMRSLPILVASVGV